MIKLYTFAISHFSEKARWALDEARVPYTEHVLVPGPHMMTTRRLAHGTEVPIMVHDRRVIQGSSAILDYIERALATDRVESAQSVEQREFESELDRSLGRAVQTVVYGAALDSERAWVTKLWSNAAPTWVPAFYRVSYPVIARAVKRMYRAGDPASVAAAQVRFDETLSRLDSMLASSPYLSGDEPGRVDRVASALLAPLFSPPEHPMSWPAAPASLERYVEPYRERPICRHVGMMYREHRHRYATPYRLSSVRRHLPV